MSGDRGALQIGVQNCTPIYIQTACEDSNYFGPSCPSPLTFERDTPRMVLVTGEYASGKSFLTKVLDAYLGKDADM